MENRDREIARVKAFQKRSGYPKKYYWANREKCLESWKTYYETHKEHEAERRRKYYEANKEAFKKRNKVYYDNNASKLLKKRRKETAVKRAKEKKELKRLIKEYKAQLALRKETVNEKDN
jgi:hypothetical protein